MTQLPEQKERVETGPIRFGDDWPGVFFRGDHAIYAAFRLEAGFDLLEKGDIEGAKAVLLGKISGCRDIIADLRSCDASLHVKENPETTCKTDEKPA